MSNGDLGVLHTSQSSRTDSLPPNVAKCHTSNTHFWDTSIPFDDDTMSSFLFRPAEKAKSICRPRGKKQQRKKLKIL